MGRKKIDWGWLGCSFLVGAVILPVITFVMGGFYNPRSNASVKFSLVGAFVIFFGFGFIGIVSLIIWARKRKNKQAGKLAAEWRRDAGKLPRS